MHKEEEMRQYQPRDDMTAAGASHADPQQLNPQRRKAPALPLPTQQRSWPPTTLNYETRIYKTRIYVYEIYGTSLLPNDDANQLRQQPQHQQRHQRHQWDHERHERHEHQHHELTQRQTTTTTDHLLRQQPQLLYDDADAESMQHPRPTIKMDHGKPST